MRVTDYDKLQLKLREYADRKASNGEIELANGILKAKCFIDQECEVIEENQLTNGWIPVSERLPKEYKCVDGNDCYMMSEDILCSAYNEETGEYDMWIDYTIDGEWQTHEYYEGEKLAWQPLPPKYEEVSE